MLKYPVSFFKFIYLLFMIQVPPLFLDVRPDHFVLDSKQLILFIFFFPFLIVCKFKNLVDQMMKLGINEHQVKM